LPIHSGSDHDLRCTRCEHFACSHRIVHHTFESQPGRPASVRWPATLGKRYGNAFRRCCAGRVRKEEPPGRHHCGPRIGSARIHSASDGLRRKRDERCLSSFACFENCASHCNRTTRPERPSLKSDGFHAAIETLLHPRTGLASVGPLCLLHFLRLRGLLLFQYWNTGGGPQKLKSSAYHADAVTYTTVTTFRHRTSLFCFWNKITWQYSFEAGSVKY
jgi:hypothetical protein